MMKHLFLTLAATVSCAFAQAPPEWAKDLTPSTTGPFATMLPMSLDFQLSWKGMLDSGKLRMDFAPPDVKKPGRYVVRTSASSTGAAAALFPYQHSFWAELDSKTMRPSLFRATEVDKKESSTTTVQYQDSKVVSSETTKNLQTGKVSTKDRTFLYTPVYDIFSAMLHVRSQNLNTGEKVCMVIQPFDQPYLLRVQSMGSEMHNGQKAIRLSLSMSKIHRRKMTLEPYTKLNGPATLWLSDDADRVPIEFRAAVFIGEVRATLVNRQKL